MECKYMFVRSVLMGRQFLKTKDISTETFMMRTEWTLIGYKLFSFSQSELGIFDMHLVFVQTRTTCDF